MEDTRWIRLVTIGLVLAAMAVGYFLLAQRFSNNNTKVSQTQPEVVVTTPSPTSVATSIPSPSPSVLGVGSTSPVDSTTKGGLPVTKGGVQTLPATGFPGILLVVFSAGAIVAGFGLRKFPH